MGIAQRGRALHDAGIARPGFHRNGPHEPGFARAAASSAEHLPAWPQGWLVFCRSRDLGQKPLGRQLLGRRLVAFRGDSGRIGVLEAACPHLGTNLAAGAVVGDTLQCPFHHWRFDAQGRCRHIPATDCIPDTARQTAFAADERDGLVFLYHGGRPAFPLPSWTDRVAIDEDTSPAESAFRVAPPFVLSLDCPWYMVGANAVDVQHFRTTHDRQLLGEPEVALPDDYAHRTRNRFAVVGRGWADRLTRWFAGDRVTLDVTDWAGTLFFVRATFDRTETFGLVGLVPVEQRRTEVHVAVGVRARRGILSGGLLDGLRARVRSMLVRRFLEPDVGRSAGTDYRAENLIEADRTMADYFLWLKSAQSELRGSP